MSVCIQSLAGFVNMIRICCCLAQCTLVCFLYTTANHGHVCFLSQQAIKCECNSYRGLVLCLCYTSCRAGQWSEGRLMLRAVADILPTQCSQMQIGFCTVDSDVFGVMQSCCRPLVVVSNIRFHDRLSAPQCLSVACLLALPPRRSWGAMHS